MHRAPIKTYKDIDFSHIVFEWNDEHNSFRAMLYEDVAIESGPITEYMLVGYGKSQLEAAVNLVLAFREREIKNGFSF